MLDFLKLVLHSNVINYYSEALLVCDLASILKAEYTSISCSAPVHQEMRWTI